MLLLIPTMLIAAVLTTIALVAIATDDITQPKDKE